MAATKLNEFRDKSGIIRISVWESRATNPSDLHTDVECNIANEEGEWVCVGGGGRGSKEPGHLLTASYPMENWKGWQVSSKSHQASDPTVTTVWAIGMIIDGLSREQLISNLRLESLASPPNSHNDFNVDLSLDQFEEQDYVLLGGGFKVGMDAQEEGMGNFGTASFIDNSFGWRARSKDMDIVTPLPINVYTIGIKQTIKKPDNPEEDFGYVNVAFSSNESLPNDPHPESKATVPLNYALCGGGACTHFSYWNGGSYLWSLEPVTERTEDPAKQSFTARAKDHFTQDPATITTYAMGVRLFPVA